MAFFEYLPCMDDRRYMARCMELAEKAKGYTTPNPMVGAVLVHNDRIIGEGWHHFFGSAHAEVNCLNSVEEQDRLLIPESTMYVNLEPCAHQGITPPCAVRVAEERVKRVVIANRDPFAKVAGRGIEILQEAGTEVVTGVMEEEGLWLNRRFFCYQTKKRPYIILKWAQSADGFFAPPDRSRLQMSGSESKRLVHQWRTEESAIIVGFLTALNDNPALTARLYEGRQPLRIALDRNLTLPQDHNLFNNDAATWIVNAQQETVSGNVHYVQLAFNSSLLFKLMLRLHEAHVLSLIVEGGAELLNGFIDAGLWDEARVFTADDVTLGNGVDIPILKNEVAALTETVGADTLHVYTNADSDYPYAKGMQL